MGEFTGVIVALVFSAIDVVTGLASAFKNKNIISGKLRDGIFKKFAFIVCYAVAWLIDTYGNEIGFEIGIKILPIIVLYVCVTEVVSILENIEKINPSLKIVKLKKLFHLETLETFEPIKEDTDGYSENNRNLG